MAPLAYAPPAAWYRRHARLTAATALVAIIAVVSMLQQDRIGRWRIAWAEHRHVLALQHQCATWSMPPDAVVVEPDPVRALQMVGRNQFRPIVVFGPGMRDGPGPRFVTGAGRHDLSWMAFQQALLARPAYGARQPGAVVFAHRVRSPAGRQDRIVVVEYFGQPSAFLTTVIEPGSWTGRSPRCLRCGDGDGAEDMKDRARRVLWVGEPGLRLFAGQPDPADGSKFAIAYEVGNARGTLHAQLRDDDTVAFEPSTGMIARYGRDNGWYPTSQPAASGVSSAPARGRHR